MSNIDDFREWLNSKDPKVVRSLVLDAYSSDRKFLRAFEKVVDSDLSSATGRSWTQLLSSQNDWDFKKYASYILESKHWDQESKTTLVGILDIIAHFIDLNWKPNPDLDNSLKDDSQDPILSSTQRAYLEQREQLQRKERRNKDEQDSQKVADYRAPSPRYSGSAPSSSSINKEVRDRRGQLVSHSSSTKSNHPGQPLDPWQTIVPLGALLLFFGLVAGLSTLDSQQRYVDDSHTETSTYEPLKKDDPVSDLELRQASSLQEKAVLICEHKRVITTLEGIKSRTNSMKKKASAELLIADSKKHIDFLDQKGTHEYWEDDNCNHGFQWFDEQNADSFKVFVAVSRKCKNPSLKFDVRSGDDESLPVINSVHVKFPELSGSHGEISVPFVSSGGTYFPGMFTCNSF